MSAKIVFRRIRGRIVPIKATGETVAKGIGVGIAAFGARAAARKYDSIGNQKGIKVRPILDTLGLGTAVASGAVAAATFSGPLRKVGLGIAASLGLDAISSASAALSVMGKGKVEERIKQGAKQEARNFLLGNLVFAGGLIGTPANRARAAALAKAAARLVRR